jgi:hypothetical protein
VEPEKIDRNAVEKPSRAGVYPIARDGPGEPDEGRETPRSISPSDPPSAWTGKANKRVQ